jgi:hypothetical protein
MPSAEPVVKAAARPGSSRNPCVLYGGPLHRAHARQEATALCHGQFAGHIVKADGTMVPRLGESGVGCFAEESHCAGTKPPQGFKTIHVECISRAVLVGKVIPSLVGIPNSSGMARGVGSGMNTGSSQGWVNQASARTWPGPGRRLQHKSQHAWGRLGGAERNLGMSPFSARGEAQAVPEFAQSFCRLVMAA